MKKLTEKQRIALLRASESTDYSFRVHKKTMTSLVELGFAFWSSGFGYRSGGICELTSAGKDARKELLNKIHQTEELIKS